MADGYGVEFYKRVVVIGACLISAPVLGQGASASTSKRALSRVVVVSKPTLISSFVATQAEVDSSDETSEALSDYQHYLSLAIPVLENHGVQVHLSNDSTLRWRDSLGVHSLSATDSGGVVYLFVSPNERKRILRQGVEIDGAILDAARHQFGIPLPIPEWESDGP